MPLSQNFSQLIEASMRAMNGIRTILLGGDMGRLDKARSVFH